MKKTKEIKRKVVYQESYNKGTIFTDKDHIIKLIKDSNTTLFAINAGKYDDNKEFITLTIDNI